MLKRLSFILVILLLISSVGEAFHHHDDGAEHPHCSICVAAHHTADTSSTAPPIALERVLTETVYSPSIITVYCKSFFTPSLGRAPPA